MEFRKAKKNELERITDIFIRETFKEPYQQQWTKKVAFERIKKAFSLGKLYVSLENSKVVGLMIFSIPKSSKKKRVYLDELWISSDYQGMGIGKSFMKFLESLCKKEGIKIIDLIAHRNAGAVKFYNKLGYKESKEFVFISKNL